MSRLSLNFLGLPEIRYNGQGVTLPTRKTLALLIYLCVEGGAHSREKLAALFWPDSDEARGRASLRLVLSYLRSALPTPYLLIEQDTLGFDLSADFELDLRRLETAIQTIRQARGKVEAAAWPRLQAAVDSYRGDFLEGFSLPDAAEFDDWASLQREHWRQRLSLILDHLSQSQFEGGELPGAIETTARWVRHDPLNEMAHRRLMQLHFAADDRIAAWRAYEACRATLSRELNADPSPETEALAERIRTSEPGLKEAAPHSRHRQAAGETENRKPVELPLVGRATEHLALVTTFRTARRNQPQAVLLEGEPGIGKSRLAKEFLGWAAAQGADIWQGRAFETGGRLPYQPLIEALRQRLERENAPDDLLADIWLVELSRLLPELRERYPDLPAPAAEDTSAPTRLFEAVGRLGQALAQQAPLILFFDDLHWADAASLDLLQYLGRRWLESKAPVLLLFCARSEALTRSSPLTAWLAGLGRELPLARLPLGPLGLDDTRRLVQSFVTPAAQPVETLGERLFAETGGQPFFLSETLKSLFEGERLSREAGVEEDNPETMIRAYLAQGRPLALPSSVREVIQARLARLSPTAMAVLTAASVLGPRFGFEEVCEVANLAEETGLEALDELLERGLLRESQAGYLFAHDKIREVVYAGAGAARQRVLHRRALACLEESQQNPGAAELARHALAAGLEERAFSLSVSAGDEAMGLFAVRDAINHYEQAYQLSRNSLREAPPSLWHLYTQLGRAYELTNQFEPARTLYEAMLNLARQNGQPQPECLALNRLANLIVQDSRFDFKEVIPLLQQAQQLAESVEDKAGLAETEWNLAYLGWNSWDLTAMLRHGERALALARDLEWVELTGRSLNLLAYGASALGDWAATERYAAEARQLYHSQGNRAMEADCLTAIAFAQIHRGQVEAGVGVARAAYMIATEIENPWGEINGALNLAIGLLESGVYGEALALAQSAVSLARTQPLPHLLSFALTVLSAVQRALLEPEAALATSLEVLALGQERPALNYTAMSLSELCTAYAVTGAWDQARLYAEQALALRERTWLRAGLTRWYEIEALLRGGEAALERIYEDVRRLKTQVEDNPRFQIPYQRCLAVLALAGSSQPPLLPEVGEPGLASAIGHLESAATLAAALKLPGEQWLILRELANLYRAGKDEPNFRRATTQAAEIAQTLAASLDDEGRRTNFLTRAAAFTPFYE